MLISLFELRSTGKLLGTSNPTWGEIFECFFKSESSKLELLFSLKRGKRDVRALSFEVSKMSSGTAQEWTNGTPINHERASVHFLVLPGSLLSITETTVYKYFSLIYAITEFKYQSD